MDLLSRQTTLDSQAANELSRADLDRKITEITAQQSQKPNSFTSFRQEMTGMLGKEVKGSEQERRQIVADGLAASEVIKSLPAYDPANMPLSLHVDQLKESFSSKRSSSLNSPAINAALADKDPSKAVENAVRAKELDSVRKGLKLRDYTANALQSGPQAGKNEQLQQKAINNNVMS